MTLDEARAEAESKILVMADELVSLGIDIHDDKVMEAAIDFLWENLSSGAVAAFRREVSQGRGAALADMMIEAISHGGRA